ncbi:hypothetical protein ACOSQ2_014402 [Xanthoceras sorbifolium]
MKKERKGDARIYIISGFFFICIICGGVLLGLYIFLPDTYSQSWYPILGMILVAIPWIFWFFAFFYRCCLSSNNITARTTPSSDTPATVATTAAASCKEDSPVQSPVSPGRHVHFGPVVVMGSEGNKTMNREDQNWGDDQVTPQGHLSTKPETDQGDSPHENASKKASTGSRKSEIPLAFSSD